MKKSEKFFLIALLAFLLASCTMSYAPSSSQTCKLNLQIFVHDGPNANYMLAGQVDFGSSAWSSFEGDLVEEGGTSRPISFYFNGQAIHFILDTTQGNIFGTGIMESSLASCAGKGGGTLTGPAVGDMGDWRGEWISEVIPVTPEQQPSKSASTPTTICIGLPATIFALFMAIMLFKILAPYKWLNIFKNPQPIKSRSSTVTMRRSSQNRSPVGGGSRPPLVEYLATYTASDKLFNLSFDIEQSNRYLGECGIEAINLLDKNSNQAIAFEIWLFGTRSTETTSRILVSEFCQNQKNLLDALIHKGPTVLIEPGMTLQLEMSDLIAKAQVLEMEYKPDSPTPRSVFKRLVIKIEVWENNK